MNIQKCKVDWCDKAYQSKGYCRRHYLQIYHHGKIMDRVLPNTSPNEITIYDDCAKIDIRDKNGYVKGCAIVDTKYVDSLCKYIWYATGDWNKRPLEKYVCNSKVGSLHRFILKLSGVEIPDKFVVDHINGDPLDNRINNLRVVTNQQNALNTRCKYTNKLGIKNIRYSRNGTYRVEIMRLGVSYFLGTYKNIQDAIIARDKKLEELDNELI